MKEIIKWLREIEHLASEVYSQAALFFANDENLKSFLEKTAEDEAWHYHVIGSAAEYLSTEPDFKPAISVDKEIKDKIEKYFLEMKNGLDKRILSRAELIDKVVEVELSEWNDIFLYVVNFMKDKTNEFKYPSIKIQAHVKGIEYYLETIEGRPEAVEKIKELPPIWIEKILIVDDEEMITDLIRSLLNRLGNIDIAYNGSQALKMMEEKYYKLIISDIDMPIMDGLTFYKEAVEKYPASNNRFIFMTGDLSPAKISFFNEKQVKCFSKPMDISVLREEATKILISN